MNKEAYTCQGPEACSAEWVLASACQNPLEVCLQHKLWQTLASTSTAEQASDITCSYVVWMK